MALGTWIIAWSGVPQGPYGKSHSVTATERLMGIDRHNADQYINVSVLKIPDYMLKS